MCNINIRKYIIVTEINPFLILLSKVPEYISLMTERKFDYAYLSWSLKFFVSNTSIDGQKILHQLLLFVIFSSQHYSRYGQEGRKWCLSCEFGIIWHNLLYLDIKGKFKFLKSSAWFSLRTNLSFRSRSILKSQRK